MLLVGVFSTSVLAALGSPAITLSQNSGTAGSIYKKRNKHSNQAQIAGEFMVFLTFAIEPISVS